MQYRVLMMLLALWSNSAMAVNCYLSPNDYSKQLEQDYQTFDQTEEGWRRFGPGENFCPLFAAQLIGAYTHSHTKDLIFIIKGVG